MGLGKTVKESIENRKEHILDAWHFRRKGLRKAKQSCLNLAKLERLNQRYFLGEQPF